jgi:hypothetical protein
VSAFVRLHAFCRVAHITPALCRLERIVMSKINIKNGTPIGSTSVCESCCYAQIMRGFRESELFVLCNYPTPSFVVPFKLTECTNHYDKNRPSWKQMEDLAIYVSPGRSKPAGFSIVGKPDEEVSNSETIND